MYLQPTKDPALLKAFNALVFHEAAEGIERAAAKATVGAYGLEAVWIAPTERGAVMRASECLRLGHDPEDVVAALESWG